MSPNNTVHIPETPGSGQLRHVVANYLRTLGWKSTKIFEIWITERLKTPTELNKDWIVDIKCWAHQSPTAAGYMWTNTLLHSSIRSRMLIPSSTLHDWSTSTQAIFKKHNLQLLSGQLSVNPFNLTTLCIYNPAEANRIIEYGNFQNSSHFNLDERFFFYLLQADCVYIYI